MRWPSVLVAVFSLLCLHATTLDAAVLAGPITNPANGHLYYLLAPSGWVAAQVEARRLGGNLSTINDAAEQSWVYSQFATQGAVGRHLWIGLYDANKHFDAVSRSERMREFRWFSHETAAYRNWSSIEPNDAGGTEDCVHMWAPSDPNAGRWNDAPANLSSLFGAPLCGVVEVTPGLPQEPINPTRAPDVLFVPGTSVKISQLIGDYDRHLARPTENLTQRQHQLSSTDLGVSFEHDGKTFVMFGDVPASGDRDPMAWSTDANGEDGWSLRFVTNSNGSWKPITIPGITQAAFEVPTDGLSLGSSIYIWHTTDHSAADVMGRSVLARSDDDGHTFRLLRTFSDRHFVNVSVVQAPAEEWPGLPQCVGGALLYFGSGDYRASNARLAWQPANALESRDSMRFFAGLDTNGLPRWSTSETDAISLFNQPRVGELSVTFNPFLRRWLMLYNSESPRGINFRTAISPWGHGLRPAYFLSRAGIEAIAISCIQAGWSNNAIRSTIQEGKTSTELNMDLISLSA